MSQFLEDRYAFDLGANGAERVGDLLEERVGDVRVFTDAVRRVADDGRLSTLTSSPAWRGGGAGAASSTAWRNAERKCCP